MKAPMLCAVSLLLLVSITSTAAAGFNQTAPKKKPITKEGLVAALRINGLTTAELVQQVEMRGVDFVLTDEIEKELRAVGAQPALIAAVRANSRSAPTSATSPARPDRGVRLDDNREAQPTVNVAGSYHALVIGNNAYQHMPRLKTAESDASAVEGVLREQYGFETKLLINATRQQIIAAINFYRRSLDQNANLLIYYAGHGYNDRDADKGYWLPVDAQLDDNANWISADDITTNTKVIPAKHVLIISDSCYSGTIYRAGEASLSTPVARDRFVEKMLKGKSRTLMASGGNEPVADSGSGNHSVFAGALLRGLSQNEMNTFTGTELFRDYVQESVAGRANQTPEYNPLRNSGHESGDFVFIRKRR